jgi:hypothetical protein
MLTVNGIKNFCFESIGIFLWSKDDIKVEKRGMYYFITLNKPRAPTHLITKEWERRVAGTKYEDEHIQLNIY